MKKLTLLISLFSLAPLYAFNTIQEAQDAINTSYEDTFHDLQKSHYANGLFIRKNKTSYERKSIDLVSWNKIIDKTENLIMAMQDADLKKAITSLSQSNGALTRYINQVQKHIDLNSSPTDTDLKHLIQDVKESDAALNKALEIDSVTYYMPNKIAAQNLIINLTQKLQRIYAALERDLTTHIEHLKVNK